MLNEQREFTQKMNSNNSSNPVVQDAVDREKGRIYDLNFNDRGVNNNQPKNR